MFSLIKKLIGAMVVILFLSSYAFSTPVIINDNYYGSNDHGYGDVIGSVTNFGISSMEVELLGTILNVKINTGFGGKGDDGLFSSYIPPNGIGYGDLFLSGSWTPYGTDVDHYINDNHSTGTIWSYGFALDNRWGKGGNGILYRLSGSTNHSNALLSEDFINCCTFRNGQEVAVNTASPTTSPVGSGTWTTDTGYVQFVIDLAGTSLLGGSEIAIHWGPTCANDVIEGAYSTPVPEPSTVILIGTGIFAFAFLKKRSLFVS